MEQPYPGSYKTTLRNGLRILVEPLPDRPLAVGIWVTVGSRDEPETQAGVAHFVEHMVFKGTKRRTAFQISEEVDGLGGYINALTHKEYTLFHIDSLPRHLEASLDILADLVAAPLFQEADILKEKGVVLEEIRMADDDPQERVFDLFTENIWNHDHPLSRPILGSSETILNLDRTGILRHYAHYHPKHLILTVVGTIDPHEVTQIAQSKLGDLQQGPSLSTRRPPQPKLHFGLEDRDSQQAHICLGSPSLSRKDERRFALEVLNTVLGGGMSSRLFKRIREESGLAYSVFSSCSFFQDSGLFMVYIGTEPPNARRVIEMTREEIERLMREPVPAETLRLTKEKLKGNLVLAMETSGSRLGRLGLGELYDSHLPLDEVMAKIDAVSAEDVLTLARSLFQSRELSLCLVGPENELAGLEQISTGLLG
jgi:predicted Zn-dependent peptidase